MPNNLTDTEIKKALECCVASKHICHHDCPMVKNKECLESLRKSALDLINRKEAEIEELKGIIFKYNGNLAKQVAENESLKAEVERLRESVEQLTGECLSYRVRLDTAKAEAHKDFGNKLERAFSKSESQMPNSEVVKQTVQICRNAIRIVLNELVGDGNGE